jgi:DNA-binding NarL/FixJ family response regulator
LLRIERELAEVIDAITRLNGNSDDGTGASTSVLCLTLREQEILEMLACGYIAVHRL